MKDLTSCDFIIDNVTGDWGIKKPLYERLGELMPPEVCFGANTSCISITQIGSASGRPANIVGVHFMNPVHLKPAVEVIRGFHTSDQAVNTLLQLLAQLNKQAIIVEDMPGFVSNRVSHLFMNEAAFVLQDNVSTAEKIDMIFKKCFGHMMGPLETPDLIGLDTVMHSVDVLYESYRTRSTDVVRCLESWSMPGISGAKPERASILIRPADRPKPRFFPFGLPMQLISGETC